MAYTSREIAVPSRQAYAAIVDPTTYDDWLIGARAIRDVDADWPAPGSKFHHRVGIGPLQIPDDSEVLAIEPELMLRLRVRARPLLSAVVTFRVLGDGDRCVVTLEEEPSMRWAGAVLRPVMEPAIHVRNHRSLRNLARFLEAGRPATR